MKHVAPIDPAKPARGSSPSNRSLERGILVLRAFRPGSDLLGNGELAERTGLPRATVSRLTQTLVGSGMLEHDAARRAYRLAAPVLSLAHAMRSGSVILDVATPLMRAEAERLRVNVGLAVADGNEMVYLKSVRYNSKLSLRSVVMGQRIPMELTSLGRAYLALAVEDERIRLFDGFAARQRKAWPGLRRAIAEAAESVRRTGLCAASWQPEVVAVATPLVIPNRPVHVLNMSVSTRDDVAHAVDRLGPPLLALREQILQALQLHD
jgi:DNA-binding IclR family transcriptional regulator